MRLFALLALSYTLAQGADPRPEDHSGDGASNTTTPNTAQCTVEGLTRDCALLDPKTTGPYLKLPDGTRIKNYAYHEPFDPSSLLTQDPAQIPVDDNAQEKFLALREVTAEALNALGKEKVSLRFMLALTDGAAEASPFTEVWHRWLKDPADPTDDGAMVYLPFPPEDAKAAPRFVPFKDVRQWLDTHLAKSKADIKKAMEASATANEGPEPIPATQPPNDTPPERVARVEELFKEAKSRVKDLLGARMARPNLSEQAKKDLENARAKVERLSFLPHDSEPVLASPLCSGPVGNAFYDGGLMAVALCPNFYSLPDAAVLNTLGHEIGHAIDPCNSQCDVCTVDKDKLTQKIAPPPPSEGEVQLLFAPLPEPELALGMTLQLRADQSPTFSLPMEMWHDPKMLAQYQEQGILRTDIPGTPFERYPFKDAYDCFASPEGGGFRKFNEAAARTAASEIVAARASDRLGPVDTKARAAEQRGVTRALTRYPECASVGQQSQMGETIADWIGAEVLGSHLADQAKRGNRLDTPIKRLAAFGHKLSLICAAHFMEAARGMKGQEDTRALLDEYHALGDPHPGTKKRLEQVILKNSKVRSALGCPPDSSECGKEGGTKK